MTTLFRDIRQESLAPASSPLAMEIATSFGDWYLQWAQEQPEVPFVTYWIGDVLIGFVHGEAAYFDTVAEFVEGYEDMNRDLWCQYDNESDAWLWDQTLARAVATGTP